MAARRKGKPQQRKQIETLEPAQDLLTCGDCQREFMLCDIAKFIQHKVSRCNKENIEPFDHETNNFSENEDDEDNEGRFSISSRRTSISAPIAPKRERSPRPSLQSTPSHGELDSPQPDRASPEEESESMDVEDCEGDKHNKKSKINRELEPPKSRADAQINTHYTEPTKITCGTCNSQYRSAWYLIQHVQNKHGVKIYLDEPASPEPAKNSHVKEEREVKPEPSPIKPPPLLPSIPERRYDLSRESSNEVDQREERSHFEFRHREHRTSTPNLPSKSAQEHNAEPTARRSQTPPISLSLPQQHPQSPSLSSYFRIPLSERQQVPQFGPHHNPFSRPHGTDFRIPEFLSNDPFNRLQSMMPGHNPYEHGPPGFPGAIEHKLRAATGLTSHEISFYSERLRKLAGNPPSPTPASPRKQQHTPPFQQPQPQQQPQQQAQQESHPPKNTPFTPSQPNSSQLSPSAENNKEKEATSPSITPGKLKACEFCGKCFRFQSNLIVHRRSHTGEKPYKCPLCPHACTQASKLKRHMKTHNKSMTTSSNISTSSDASGRSPASTPDSKFSKPDDPFRENESDDEDLDDDELDEELDLDEDPEEVMRERQAMEKEMQQQEGGSNSRGADHAYKPRERFSYSSENSLSNFDTPDNSRSGLGERRPSLFGDERSSLLSEVMQNTGLGDIQQYNEAFKQALAESNTKDDENRKMRQENGVTHNSKEIVENGLDTSKDERDFNEHPEGRKSTPASHENDYDRRSLDQMSSPSSTTSSKRIKLESEPSDSSHFSPQPMDMYPRMWYPPMPHDNFAMSLSIRAAQAAQNDHFRRGLSENGINAHESSALSMGQHDHLHHSPKAGGQLHPHHMPPTSVPTAISTLGVSGSTPKKDRRNDTCEFCGKVFKNCSNLTVHRRSHTGEKPYKCQLCNYACAQSSKLTRHMRTHGRIGKDVYRCKFCSMPFSVPSTLEKHMRRCVENTQNRSQAAGIPHHTA